MKVMRSEICIKFLWENPESSRQLARSRRRCEDSIKIDFIRVDLFNLNQCRDQCPVLQIRYRQSGFRGRRVIRYESLKFMGLVIYQLLYISTNNMDSSFKLSGLRSSDSSCTRISQTFISKCVTSISLRHNFKINSRPSKTKVQNAWRLISMSPICLYGQNLNPDIV